MVGGCAGPPWPHVAVLLLLMLGVRSHSVLAVLALALAATLALLHARGLRCASLSCQNLHVVTLPVCVAYDSADVALLRGWPPSEAHRAACGKAPPFQVP